MGVVYLNGREIGATPITIPKVPEGRHKIKVVREGFKELEMDIRVEPKKEEYAEPEAGKEIGRNENEKGFHYNIYKSVIICHCR